MWLSIPISGSAKRETDHFQPRVFDASLAGRRDKTFVCTFVCWYNLQMKRKTTFEILVWYYRLYATIVNDVYVHLLTHLGVEPLM